MSLCPIQGLLNHLAAGIWRSGGEEWQSRPSPRPSRAQVSLHRRNKVRFPLTPLRRGGQNRGQPGPPVKRPAGPQAASAGSETSCSSAARPLLSVLSRGWRWLQQLLLSLEGSPVSRPPAAPGSVAMRHPGAVVAFEGDSQLPLCCCTRGAHSSVGASRKARDPRSWAQKSFPSLANPAMESLALSETPLRCGCRRAELVFPSSAHSGRFCRVLMGAGLGSAALGGSETPGCRPRTPSNTRSAEASVGGRPAAMLPASPGLALAEQAGSRVPLPQLRAVTCSCGSDPRAAGQGRGAQRSCLETWAAESAWGGMAEFHG